MDQIVSQISIMFPDFARWFSAGFIVFARLLGFIRFAPVFNRKEIAGIVKLAFAFILTMIITPLIKPGNPPADSLLLLLVLNFAAGASILSRVITLLGLVIFMEIGGFYWIINALIRSFEIFPIYAVVIPLEKIINLDYLITTTSNVLYMGLQIAAPILLATLGQDIILGVISKTAPQVNVFQLSFLFKPVLGAAIMIWILPMLINVISEFFTTYSSIY